MNNPISDALSIIKNERQTLAKKIDEHRATEARCAGRIADLMAMPVSLDDFGIFFRAYVERVGASWFSGGFAHLMLSQSGGATPANKMRLSGFQDENGAVLASHVLGRADFERSGNGGFAMMCFFQPELVHARMMEGFEQTLGDRWGNESLPTVAQRNEEIKALREEAAIARAAREGLEPRLGVLVAQ